MNFQKVKVFKDRKAILKNIIDNLQQKNIDLKKVIIIVKLDSTIEFFILHTDKKFTNNFKFEIDTLRIGTCKCYVESFQEFYNHLSCGKYWLNEEDKCQLFLDLSHKFKSFNDFIKPKKENFFVRILNIFRK